jgi:ADP-L-glycero-D-manno-heptose 6-epimerase
MILITGGAGFIGSNLVAALSNKPNLPKIVIVDRFGIDDKWKNLAKHLVYEIINPDQLQLFLSKHENSLECIFHLGAISSTTEKDVDLILQNNFNLSLHLWKWCTSHNVPFIYASSAATYGNGDHGFEDNSTLHDLSKLRPLNPYGWSKHLFDKCIMSELERGGAHPPQWAGLKFFNVYGPNEIHKGNQSSLVAQMHPHIAKNEPAILFKSHQDDTKDGEQSRDFIWIDDCIDIMLWFYKNNHVSGLFNVGTGQARSFKDLATIIFHALDREPHIEYVDTPINIRDQYQYFTKASTQKLKNVGYDKPFTSLEDGVTQYVKKYLSTIDPYK